METSTTYSNSGILHPLQFQAATSTATTSSSNGWFTWDTVLETYTTTGDLVNSTINGPVIFTQVDNNVQHAAELEQPEHEYDDIDQDELAKMAFQ